MALTGKLGFKTDIAHTGASDLSTLLDTMNSSVLPLWPITDGTGLNEADVIWHDQRTLASSTSEEIDLAGSLTDVFGTVLTFARIKGILISSALANGALIQVGGSASNGFVNWVASATDIINVRNGGTFALIAPDATAYAVTAGTGDKLKITNTDGAATATYDIIIIGASA